MLPAVSTNPVPLYAGHVGLYVVGGFVEEGRASDEDMEDEDREELGDVVVATMLLLEL